MNHTTQTSGWIGVILSRICKKVLHIYLPLLCPNVQTIAVQEAFKRPPIISKEPNIHIIINNISATQGVDAQKLIQQCKAFPNAPWGNTLLTFREYTTLPSTTGAFSFSVWLALMISLDSHSNWGTAYGTSATSRGVQQQCRTRGPGICPMSQL